MRMVNMHEAKTGLSRLVRSVREGLEPEIIIAVDGVPAARLTPYLGVPRRLLGVDSGLIKIADDFDGPNADLALLFEGSDAP